MMIEYVKEFEIKYYDELDSTQAEAKRLLGLGRLSPGSVIATLNQTSGVGRYGRTWIGVPGNLALTLVLKINPEEGHNISQLCYVAAVAIGQALSSFGTYLEISYKWVNDILIYNKKVSGILIERLENNLILVGIGINLKPSPALEAIGATSLEEYKINITPQLMCEKVVDHFLRLYNEWLVSGFIGIKNQWLHKAKGINSNIIVNYPSCSIEGIFLGIDEEGNLEMMVGNSVKLISSGELFFK